MKLRYSPTSPFVRKVTILAIETGLDDRIERIATNPWDADTDLGQTNPLGKVPTLELDDGQVLFESRVICEVLDGMHDGPKMFPSDPAARCDAIRRQALGDGMTDAGVLLLVEKMRRPKELQWDWWIDRQGTNVARAMDAMEADGDGLASDSISIGHIAIAAGLGWIDLRFPDMNWRDTRPKLAAWFADFSERPSMQATVPPAS